MTEPQFHLDRQLAKACEDLGKAFDAAFGAALAALVHRLNEASRSESTPAPPDREPEQPVIPIADLNQEQLSELVGKTVDIVGIGETSRGHWGQGDIGMTVIHAGRHPEPIDADIFQPPGGPFITVRVQARGGSCTYYGRKDHPVQWGVRLHRTT